ncbi:MAG TPA: substrate-binding domain-containing protein, partial [Armatimonadota bacterium]
EAIHYLARQGRRRIAYLGQAHSITRLAGYYRALAELGISPLLIEVDDRDDEQFSAARDAARRFAELSPRPDAVQAYSDVMALGFIAGLHDLGISVPGEVAVIGFDDRRMAEVSWPLLTTVAQPSREVGVLAGKILLKKIAQEMRPPEGWTQTLPTRLVVRESA